MRLGLKYIIAYQSVSFLSNTWRIESNFIPERNSIIAFWHGKMLPVWKFFSKYNSSAVVSMSKDGELLSKLLIKWNYSLIRGSSSRGGKDVLEAMIWSNNDYLLITPDGPRGPNHKFKPGAVITALRTGKSLYLCNCIIGSKKVFSKSWDNFELPLLFSSIKLNFSEPIRISKDLQKEEIEKIIQDCEFKLNQINTI